PDEQSARLKPGAPRGSNGGPWHFLLPPPRHLPERQSRLNVQGAPSGSPCARALAGRTTQAAASTSATTNGFIAAPPCRREPCPATTTGDRPGNGPGPRAISPLLRGAVHPAGGSEALAAGTDHEGLLSRRETQVKENRQPGGMRARLGSEPADAGAHRLTAGRREPGARSAGWRP